MIGNNPKTHAKYVFDFEIELIALIKRFSYDLPHLEIANILTTHGKNCMKIYSPNPAKSWKNPNDK